MRSARKYSTTGLYHVVSRGVNKQNIYYDDEDHKLFKSLLNKYKERYGIQIHTSVLMDNHFHLLIEDPFEKISAFIQIVESVYARAFNKKYDRIGHLFQNRFISEPILDEKYYKVVFRYILQNPKKAGISKNLSYKWSSYGDYKKKSNQKLQEIVYKYFGGSENLYKFVNEYAEEECIDIEMRASEKEQYKIRKIQKLLNSKSPLIPPNLPLEEIKAKVRLLRNEGLSIKSISRLTGIMSWVVASA